MTFTENIANILEVCKLKNLTVYKFIMELCVVLRSQLLSQVQVELEEYMHMCTVRAPFLGALKSGTVDDATFRVSVMGTVMAEWRINRRVRQQTAKLQREIVKRQAEEQPVPCCSPAWIYQDFPSLLSETKAESLPISVLCDLILKRYDLTKDTEFRDLHCEVESELQRQQPDHVDQGTQNDSQNNQSLLSSSVPTTCVTTPCVPTTCVQRESIEPNSLPMRADWFRHYQPAQPYTEVSLFDRTGRSIVVEASVHHKTTNHPEQLNRHDTKRHMSQFETIGHSYSTNSHVRPMFKAASYCSNYNRPEVKKHNNQFGNSSCTNKTALIRDSKAPSNSRKYVRPRAHPYKQTKARVAIEKSAVFKNKTSTQRKNFDQKIDEYLSSVCPYKTKAEHTETKSPEFSSAHLGGLVIKIAKKPNSVRVPESKQPKEELAVKERNRQAFLAHVARIQYKLKENMKAEVQTDNNNNSKKRALSVSSVCNRVKTKADIKETAGSVIGTQKDNSHKRKATDVSMCSNLQSKCVRLDTSCAVINTRKRKAPDASMCQSIQTKYATLDTGSAVKALKRHVVKREQ